MDSSKLIRTKRAIVEMTATSGWRVLLDRADEVLHSMVERAIDEPNRVSGDVLVLEARAARKFWKEFLQSIEASKQVEVEESDEQSTSDVDWQEVADF